MPIFEYRCKTCKKEFEALIFGDNSPNCSACGGADVEKLMSICGFVSKGSGGVATRTSASSSSCGSCSAGSCSGCGH